MDASVVNIEQLDQKQYWMERMVDNVSQNWFTCWQFQPVLNGYWKQEQTPGSYQGGS
jgi:hypothetical protein